MATVCGKKRCCCKNVVVLQEQVYIPFSFVRMCACKQKKTKQNKNKKNRLILLFRNGAVFNTKKNVFLKLIASFSSYSNAGQNDLSCHNTFVYQKTQNKLKNIMYYICNIYRLITTYLLLRMNCDKILHVHWHFDASSTRTRRVSALDKHQNWNGAVFNAKEKMYFSY